MSTMSKRVPIWMYVIPPLAGLLLAGLIWISPARCDRTRNSPKSDRKPVHQAPADSTSSEPTRKVLHQGRYVVLSLSQRGKLQLYHVETVIQIPAKPILLHRFFQIPVR